jgi:hypothetical protein
MRAIRPTRAEDVVNTLVAYPEVWVWLLALVSIVMRAIIPTRAEVLSTPWWTIQRSGSGCLLW